MSIKNKDPSPPRKRPYDSTLLINLVDDDDDYCMWKVGDEVEHEWKDPFYREVFHPVRIMAIDKKRNTATVLMLAFTEDAVIERVDISRFHPFRPAQPNHVYYIGDRVHFKMYGRKVNGKNVDGDVGARGEGVWVKGTILDIDTKEQQICVRHIDWSSKKPNAYTQCWVERRDLRPAEYTI